MNKPFHPFLLLNGAATDEHRNTNQIVYIKITMTAMMSAFGLVLVESFG